MLLFLAQSSEIPILWIREDRMIRKFLTAKAGLFLCLAIGNGTAGERSLAFTYGPSEQVIASLNWGRWGVYGQPIVRYSRFRTSP
jgi:hypothetical protein